MNWGVCPLWRGKADRASLESFVWPSCFLARKIQVSSRLKESGRLARQGRHRSQGWGGKSNKTKHPVSPAALLPSVLSPGVRTPFPQGIQESIAPSQGFTSPPQCLVRDPRPTCYPRDPRTGGQGSAPDFFLPTLSLDLLLTQPESSCPQHSHHSLLQERLQLPSTANFLHFTAPPRPSPAGFHH